mmetsp:Transcript_30984/g.27413  ORF Transcript_30984/g.27413 Transcript_30984/m.27413 type:complete len:93 (+) Transcript_30984:284-562(+)
MIKSLRRQVSYLLLKDEDYSAGLEKNPNLLLSLSLNEDNKAFENSIKIVPENNKIRDLNKSENKDLIPMIKLEEDQRKDRQRNYLIGDNLNV